MQALKQDTKGTAGANPSLCDSAERNFNPASEVIEQIRLPRCCSSQGLFSGSAAAITSSVTMTSGSFAMFSGSPVALAFSSERLTAGF